MRKYRYALLGILCLLVFLIIVFVFHPFAYLRTTSHSSITNSWERINSLNFLDQGVLNFCQHISRKFRFFDELLAFTSTSNILKGGVLAVLIIWLWFRKNEDGVNYNNRILIIQVLLASFIAIFLGRILVLGLPFRFRPLHLDNLHLLLPYGVNPYELDNQSSFPSDHAVLFVGLSTGLVFVSRKFGLLALAYTTLFIIFPRIYLCYHFTTDVLGGALVGSSVALIVCKSKRMHRLSKYLYTLKEKRSNIFYSLFFLVIYQIADLFEGLRSIATFMLHHL